MKILIAKVLIQSNQDHLFPATRYHYTSREREIKIIESYRRAAEGMPL